MRKIILFIAVIVSAIVLMPFVFIFIPFIIILAPLAIAAIFDLFTDITDANQSVTIVSEQTEIDTYKANLTEEDICNNYKSVKITKG